MEIFGTIALVMVALFAGARVKGRAQQEKSAAEALREQARAALAQTSGELKIAGLKQPVEIIRDAWGVPHIYAQTQEDLFFAQGFVVAQDRLWQLDLWRRKAMGELAEVQGPDAVERDRFARLLRFRGDWRAEWMSYSADTKPIVESFVRGINAYIATIGDNLPVEFKLTGTRPGKWTPEVVVSRMAAYPMTGNASRELLRAMVVRELGAERTAELFPTDPPRVTRPEKGLSLEGMDTSVTAGLERAAGEVSFDGDWRDLEGSNNWTIAGAKTKSGKPILANDPHRALLLPSLRYIVHLVGPGWDVIGAGEPALPGVSIGHNKRIAFGLTIFAADQQDIVVETTLTDGVHYQLAPHLSVIPQMEVIEETIRVKGETQPRTVQLKFTQNGPVIFEDAKRHRAYVLRWVGKEPGTAGYLAGLAISRARNWLEFREALKRWKLPPENFVYADVDGNIGYQAAALVPNRKCDGLLPVRGDSTTCDWNGWLTLDDLPREYNPTGKFFATANNNTLPAAEKKLIGFEWSTAYRVERVREVLAATQ
ncbi:MAG: penicillin acylase family protein, partial [Acidobacteria bacterium]|nr:penicillin acylase family protein [Acidobacteriota bacterium]